MPRDGLYLPTPALKPAHPHDAAPPEGNEADRDANDVSNFGRQRLHEEITAFVLLGLAILVFLILG